jgi:8-amino-7-oxononanoate synthase
VLDFTSSLYLGMRHGSASLRGWAQLTTGVPPALRMAAGAAAVGDRLAALQGCELAVLFPSTLHAFWDLCDALCDERVAIFVDGGTYPLVARVVERARLRNVTVELFAHHTPRALAVRIAQRRKEERPVVVTDGFCTSCGRPAPLGAYLDQVRRHGGRVIVDDTQALGILGAAALQSPYGVGGGGSLQHLGIEGNDLVIVASLAKAFGVPLAVLSGARAVVAPFERMSMTRVHSSGISAAAIRAAEHALDENEAHGEELRWLLFENVRRFRSGLEQLGRPASEGHFPVQFPCGMVTVLAARVHETLRRDGIRAVLLRGGCGGASMQARVGFVLNAKMAAYEIDAAIAALSRALEMTAAVMRRA